MDAMTGIAGPGTIFRSAPMSESGIAPQFGAASTRLAPAAPPLAYSMTGNMEALTDYVHAYESGPNDFYEAQGPYDIDPGASDPALDASSEQAPERPARKSFLLVGSLAAGFIGIGIAILTTAVVVTVTPTADQKPITSTQQPVPEPLATRVSEPSAVVPASAPVQPVPAPPAPPAPAVIAPVPKAPVTPRQAPRATQTQTHTTQTTTPVSDQDGAPGDPPPHRSRYTTDDPPADEGDVPPPEQGEVPPHRTDPPLDNGDSPPPRGHSPFSPHLGDGGGLLGSPGCIPLLPC